MHREALMDATHIHLILNHAQFQRVALGFLVGFARSEKSARAGDKH